MTIHLRVEIALRDRRERKDVARIGDDGRIAREDSVARERRGIDAVADPPGLEMEMDELRLTVADEAHELASEDPASIRAFVGYAGWTAGQLEAEMKQKAWILQQPTRETLTPARLPKLWFEIMRGLGPWYKMLAAAPDDPSLN